ncbi:MAG: PAS domain S-box [Methanobacterium sp. Maddingley MBC34]|nr:MAG: PAS domain S-box [Methanobacterium sp. Maddingley MBC34]
MLDENKSKEELIDELSELKAILKSKDESTKKIIENERILSQTALELVDLPPSADLYDFIAKKLNNLLENSIIAITVYDNRSDSFHLRAVQGRSKKLNDFAQKISGKELNEIKVPLSSFNEAYPEESKNLILSGRLIKIENGLYQVLCGKLPQKLARTVETIMDLGYVYGTGFKSKGKLHGTVNIFLKKGSTLEDGELLQSLINLFAVAMQRRKAESDLEESERKYRKIFENVQDVFYQTDINGKIIEMSPSIERYSGFSRDYLIGRQVETVYQNPEDRDKMLKMIQEKGEVNDYELLLKNKYGKTVYASVNAHFLWDDNNQPVGVEGSLRDIEERKMVERALEESEAKYRTIFENISDVFYQTNMEGIITEISPSIERYSGHNPEELIGQPVEMVYLNPDDRKHLLTAIDKKGEVVDYELQLKTKTGDLIYASTNAHFLLDSHNQPIGVEGLLRDVSQRKKAEETLIDTKRRLRIALDLAKMGSWEYDVESDMFTFDDQFYSLYRTTAEKEGGSQMSSKTYAAKFIPPEEASVVAEEIERVLSTDDPNYSNEIEHVIVRADGEKRVIVVRNGIEKDEYGNTIKILGVNQDITELKKAQNEINKTLKEKEMLLKEIHHRVKNNLMVISSLLNLQSKYIYDEEARDIFRESQNRAKSMALIHERLYRSTDLKRIDFGDYIRTLSNDLYHTYMPEKSRININMDLENLMVDINTTVPLGLIVNELITNSMKHAFKEGEGEINIIFHKKGDEFTLIIGDNGVGLPADLDFRNTETLGLQLVNNLTAQIDGAIELERSHGTRFKITFKEQYN